MAADVLHPESEVRERIAAGNLERRGVLASGNLWFRPYRLVLAEGLSADERQVQKAWRRPLRMFNWERKHDIALILVGILLSAITGAVLVLWPGTATKLIFAISTALFFAILVWFICDLRWPGNRVVIASAAALSAVLMSYAVWHFLLPLLIKQPSSLKFTSLAPLAMSTKVVGFQPTLTALGFGFLKVTKVTLTQTGAANGTFIYDQRNATWNAAVSAGKLVVNSDTHITLKPVVTGSADARGVSIWTVTFMDATGATADQSFTLNYTPPISLKFTSLAPRAMSTKVVGFQPTLTALGFGFDKVTKVTLTQTGAANGTFIYDQRNATWNAAVSAGKLVVNSDTHITLKPVVTGLADARGVSIWTVTFTDTTGATAHQSFKLNYTH